MKRHNSFWSGDFSCGGVRMVWRGAWLLLALCLLSLNVTASSPVPVITSVVPNTGQIGSVVTINGANFDPAANNAVYFGPVKATVKSVTATRLVVSVPAGAAYAPITETVDSLTAYSPQPFSPGFLGNGGNLATNSFSSQIPVNAGTIQSSVALADLDGDGRADLITANYAANSISIYQNVSTNSAIGTNSFAPPLTISLGAEVSDVAVGDLDGDGRLDLVVCSPTGVLFILQNTSTNGVISFANAFTIPAPDNSRVSLIRDIDGDGKSDLVVPSYGDSVLAVYQNVSVPGLLSEDSFAAPVDFPIPSGAFTIAVGDLNGDGKPDLVTANGVAVSIFRNTATVGVIDANSFATRIDLAHPAAGVAVADIDGDGLSDLVTADQNNNSITVLRNTTTALNNITFAPGVSFPTGFNTYWVSVADLNGDGFPDVVAGSENGTGVAIFQNAAVPGNSLTNSLQPPVILNGGVGPHEVVIGDLDGDGRMDIVVNNFGSTYLSIFQNRAPFAGVPTFTLEPTNEVVTFGGNTAFTVAALGSTDLSYQWSFNGTNIAGGTSAVLPITNAQFTNIGTYFVTVSNAYGTATSSIVSLSMPALIITQPASITNDFGSTAVFTVVAGGSAPIDYQWLLNGTNLLGQTNATLTLPNVQTNVAGIYSVAVSNVFGGALSSGATLTVIGAPIIVTQPAAQTVKPGNSASFSVGAIGAGVLQYQWYFNGNAISGATNTVFTLNGVQVANAGFYSVVVSNALGSVTSSNAGLTVNAIPVITSFTPGFAINGATVTITGVNFSPTATNNIVYFGAVRATVSAASPTNLVVSVPVGATTEPITETVGGLTAYSSKSFVPTFVGNGAAFSAANFGAQLKFPAPSRQNSIAVADLDNDGRPDLITADFDNNSISIYRNLSPGGVLGTNSLAARFTIPVGGGATHVSVGDLDGDGLLDLVVSVQGGSTCVFKNTSTPGNISFAPFFTLTPPGDSHFALIRDIDGDGKPDIIMSDMDTDEISIYQNISIPGSLNASSFAAPVNFSSALGGQSAMLAAGDLNGDGKPDLVLGNNTSISIFRNTSKVGVIDNTSFAPHVDINQPAWGVAVGDMDGDSLPDVVTADTGNNTFSVLRNTTTNSLNITFAQAASFPTEGRYAYDVAIGDLNGDGRPDVVVTSPSSESLAIFQNQSQPGSVSFGSVVTLPTDGGVREAVLVDLDGDGRLDLAAACLEGSSYLTVYQNLIPLATPPIIVTQPINQSTIIGGNASFSVTATGALPLSYQWSFDGTNIAGATNSILSLVNVQTNLLGSYAVTVTNSLGIAVSSNAILSVLEVPVITSFSPRSGTNGAVVNISGINFDPTAGNNIVYFGAVRATIVAASLTNLVVTVPAGSTYAPITETVRGLTAFSSKPFLPVFSSGGLLGTNSFGPQITLSAGNGPAFVASGDLDGDGKPDVVVANIYDGTIYIYRNTSTNGQLTAATFSPPIKFAIGGGGLSDFISVVLADLDGDGRLDIVAVDRELDVVSIFQNLSSPGSLTTNSFSARVDLLAAGSPKGLAVVDLDGDGHPEIIAGDEDNSMVSVYRNLGQTGLITTNSFASPIAFAAGTGLAGVVAADIDGDGKQDLIGVGSATGSSMSVLRNTSTLGNISFAPEVDIAGPGGGYILAVGDLDGDGKLDAVYAAESNDLVSVYQNTSTAGNVSFALPVTIATSGWANTVAIGDLDGDGRPDLVVGTQSPDNLSIFKNISTNGNLTAGSFGTRIDLPSGYNVNGIVIDDFDCDGRPDIACGNDYSESISIYQNLIPFGAPTVVTEPVNQFVFIGQNTSFDIVATGAAPLSYQWSFNGTNIIGATNEVLSVNPVVAASAGSYSVTVSNPLGSITSSNAFLTILQVPVITGFSPRSGTNGAVVNISGINFEPTAGSNIVYFGAVRASIVSGSSTNLVVIVPVGATTDPITETVGGLTAYSSKSFIPSFIGSGAPIARPGFGPELNFVAPSGQNGIAVADVDGDGRPDLITADRDNNTISIYRNISTNGVLGTNSLAAPVTIPVAGATTHVAVGDLDGDGLLDLVADTDNNGACVFKNTSTPGNISFAPYFVLPAPADSRSVLIRDIDGDGKPDVVLVGTSAMLSIYQNVGAAGNLSTSSFAPRVDFAGAGLPVSVATGDLNNDGKPDLVVGAVSFVSIFENTSTPGIINSNSLAPRLDIVHPVYGVAVGDIDGDGLADVVTADLNNNTMSVFLNTTTNYTNITFASGVSSPAGGNYPDGVAIGDLSGDGKLDVVVSCPNSSSLSVFQNESQAGMVSFGTPVVLPTPGGVRDIVLADLDGDGRLDIAANNLENSATVTVYQNLIPLGTPPVIVMEPISQSALLGGTANFQVTAIGLLPLLYQWSFAGTNIFGATNAVLNLTGVQLTNSGGYSVAINNSLGSVISTNVTLSVYAQNHFTWNAIPSPRFLNQSFSITIQARDDLGNIVTNFTGIVNLTSTNGIVPTPAITTAFTNGVWSGPVKIAQVLTNLVLQATDQYNNIGLANPINVVDLPTISSVISGQTLLLFWPSFPGGFVIESTDNLATGNWSPVTGNSVTIGNQIEIPVSIAESNRFYRLRFPGP